MRGRGRALLRLLVVQGAWSYERMTGIGMGYAAEPLLEDLATGAPERHREATARAAEYFNSHPYLAGLALGAAARAEHDGVPGAQIQRLRTALCSPLGALGDQVFWAGEVPILMGAALAALALGAAWVVLPSVILVHVAARVLVAHWALATGLGTGMQVGTAISASWLPRAVARLASPAGFLVGLALPLAAAWLVPAGPGHPALVAGLAGALALGVTRLGGFWSGPRVALLLAAAALAWGVATT